jgi:hypothetical protein
VVVGLQGALAGESKGRTADHMRKVGWDGNHGMGLAMAAASEAWACLPGAGLTQCLAPAPIPNF